ncbi:alpha/beta fold hydrolase [Bradyrhizobium sp. 187]|uniref:alpha/beta hydrolase family protein n=1 Tax=Bradyrhizobium sp. 187 TaxID=2782655 RepID=UPI001FFF468C|nr:alpha/beta fold hydrolase [Bradyrhizobium sp. 187]UPJ71832.1 alpha/beta fold hydrolase [Bradyrhizobium sp. 187]
MFIHQYTSLTSETVADLTEESQDALAQFSVERLTGYGCDHADAAEIRARVRCGEAWASAATELANRLTDALRESKVPVSDATRIAFLRRASSLLRMGQIIMLADSDTRRSMMRRASDLHLEAAQLDGSYEKILIDGDPPMVGWIYPARAGQSVRADAGVLVVGGIEGWAMDLHAFGVALSERGITALLVDGPGQGETRLEHRHFMRRDWIERYRSAVDALSERCGGARIGILGNSMGGSFVTLVASADQRIAACCNNGGAEDPLGLKQRKNFFAKLQAFCGDLADSEVDAIWTSVRPNDSAVTLDCPYLIIQGGSDPLVSVEESQRILARARSRDKSIHVFSDGVHCLYNHTADMRPLVADWMRSRLT